MWIVKGVLLGVVIFIVAGISYILIRVGITRYRNSASRSFPLLPSRIPRPMGHTPHTPADRLGCAPHFSCNRNLNCSS